MPEPSEVKDRTVSSEFRELVEKKDSRAKVMLIINNAHVYGYIHLRPGIWVSEHINAVGTKFIVLTGCMINRKPVEEPIMVNIRHIQMIRILKDSYPEDSPMEELNLTNLTTMTAEK